MPLFRWHTTKAREGGPKEHRKQAKMAGWNLITCIRQGRPLLCAQPPPSSLCYPRPTFTSSIQPNFGLLRTRPPFTWMELKKIICLKFATLSILIYDFYFSPSSSLRAGDWTMFVGILNYVSRQVILQHSCANFTSCLSYWMELFFAVICRPRWKINYVLF